MVDTTENLFFKTVLLSGFVAMSLACNGYVLQVKNVQNCSPDSIIKLDKLDSKFDAQCNVIMTGCVEITKNFKTMKGKYSYKKTPLPAMTGDVDFCEAIPKMNDKTVTQFLDSFGFPQKCPVPMKKSCGTRKVSIAKYKNQIGMASGTSEIKLELEHDVGKSCIEMTYNIKKDRKGR